MSMNPTLIFLFGAITGATGLGFLALVIHLRTVEALKNYHLNKLTTVRDRAYSQGYRDHAMRSPKAVQRI